MIVVDGIAVARKGKARLHSKKEHRRLKHFGRLESDESLGSGNRCGRTKNPKRVDGSFETEPVTAR